MFNPLVRLEGKMIPGLRKSGMRYLVSQEYLRGRQYGAGYLGIPLLFSRYSDVGSAKVHLDAIKGDKYAAIVDLENETHRNKIASIVAPDSNYFVFLNVTQSQRDLDLQTNEVYMKLLVHYLENNTTVYFKSPNLLKPRLQLVFGKWYIHLAGSYGSMRIALDDIEPSGTNEL